MAEVRKKGKVWVVNHCKNGKRWKQETFHNGDAARKRANEINTAEDHGTAFSKKDSVTLEQAARAFIIDRQKRLERKRRDDPARERPGGIECYDQRFRYYVLPRISMVVCDIEKKHVQQMIYDLQDAGYKPRTVIGA